MKHVRIAMITSAAMAISGAAHSETLKFNGALFNKTTSAPNAMSFTPLSDIYSAETVTIRSIDSSGTFDDIARTFIVRAKTESGDAKLLVMENRAKKELMVAYLKELAPHKMLYIAERLSVSAGTSPLSVAYSSEFEAVVSSDKQDTNVKASAIKALATFDMIKARRLLKSGS